MPFDVETQTIDAVETPKADEMVLRWRPYASKIAAIEVSRKGARGKSEHVITLAGSYDPEQDGETDDWLRAMAYRVLELCDVDANGRAFRYVVQTFGEGPNKDRRPTIGSPIAVTIDSSTPAEASEQTAVMRELRDLFKFLSGEVKTSYGTTREILDRSIALSEKIGNALVRRDEIKWQYEKDLHEQELKAKVDIASVHADMVRGEARWRFFQSLLDGISPMFRPLFDQVFNGAGDAATPDDGKPTAAPTLEELAAVFEGHEDLHDLAVALIQQPADRRGPIREAFLRRYTALQQAERDVIMRRIYALPKNRIAAIGAWLVAEGLAGGGLHS